MRAFVSTAASLALIASAAGGAWCQPPVAGKDPQPSAAQIEAWIAGLGDKSYTAREQAAARLTGQGFAAIPHLEKATAASDAEIRSRARRILDELRKDLLRQTCRAVFEDKKDREIDWMIDLFTTGALVLDDERAIEWGKEVATKLTAQMDAERRFKPLERLTGGNGIKTGRPVRGRFIGGLWPIDAPVEFTVMDNCILLANGAVTPLHRNVSAFYGSLIMANGPIRLPYAGAANSIVVSDGSIAMERDGMPVSNCLIITRGPIAIESRGWLSHSELASCSSVTIKDATNVGTVVKERQKQPYGIRFVELSSYGVNVTETERRLMVSDVVQESALAKAGIRQGDTITAIDHTTVSSPDDVRRALRHSSLFGYAMVCISRAGEGRNLFVPLK